MKESLNSVTRNMIVSGYAPSLHLHLLGPPDVRLGEKLVTFPTRKTLALLIYLALEGELQPREHLATLLWPESNPARSYASLRNTLGHLQTALRQVSDQAQTSYLSVTHHTLALNPDANVDLDLHTVERAYALAHTDRSHRVPPESSASLPLLQSAAACHRGDFLTGFSLGDAPDFDDWAAMQREVWRRRLGFILDRLSEIQFASGDFASAAETASHWIALDVLNEVAYRRKMRAHFATGERGQALETYDACRAVLADELSVEPEPDTEALAARIRSQHPRPRPAIQLDTPVSYLENLFAGRFAEHQVLVSCYERAAAGQLQVMILRGEAGIGKTRLAKEFLAWVSAQGTEVLQGGAFESGSHMPFQPLIEALRLWLERENAPKDLLGDAWLSLLSQLLPELCERYPELPPAHLGAQTDRTKLFESFVRLTLALAHRVPLVLLVDDAQWADSATLDLLQYAIRRWRESAARIMLLVSLRSEALLPMTPPSQANLIEWLEHVGRELAPYHLELEPLGEPETVQMVLSLLAPPAADFAEWVFHETRGQPFYLMETLKDLLERGALHPKRRAAGTWAFEVDAEHDLGKAVRVPSTVRAVIRSRLHRLSPNAFTLLATGAVLEQRITFEHLCAISNVAEDMGLPALDELVSSRLLLEVAQPGTASAYAFANDMIRDVVYTEAGDARRRLFHRRALDILESARDSAAVLAHHALAGGLAEAAFRHSLAAGQEALRLVAISDAIVHFEKARQLVQERSLVGTEFESQIGELYLLLGRAYEQGGQHEQALAVYNELERLTPKQS
jgi:DNA-binding SARP family transcriptional activator/tetratricopeptide (TPR) repeat protein